MQIFAGWIPTSYVFRIDQNRVDDYYNATSLMTHCNFHDIVFSIGAPVTAASFTSDIKFQY